MGRPVLVVQEDAVQREPEPADDLLIMDELGDRLYVVRCYVCHHKMGTTDDSRETMDVCDRCSWED